MGDTNVEGGGGGHHHHHHHAATAAAAPPGSGLGPTYGAGGLTSSSTLSHATSGLSHLHAHSIGLGVGDTLSFGLGFFPDHDMNSKSLPPFSTFGNEVDGLGEGLSGRLLDLGGGCGGAGGGGGGGAPWDLYGEGLSARLIDVGGPTTLGLGIGVGLTGLGFAPPPPTAVPASVASLPNGAGGGGAPGSVQYRPWESKNNNSEPATLLELGRMATPTPTIPPFTEMFPTLHGPKLPSFQSQFQPFSVSPAPPPASAVAVTTAATTTVATPVTLTVSAPDTNNANGHIHSFGQASPSNPAAAAAAAAATTATTRYPVIPTPIQARPDAPPPLLMAHHQQHHQHHHHPVHQGGPAFHDHLAASFPPNNNNNNNNFVPVSVAALSGGDAHAMHHHLGGSSYVQRGGPNHMALSPAVKIEMDDSRSPFSSQGSGGGSRLIAAADGRKKEKRKYRASSLESSESDASLCGATTATDAQVPAVSSTAPHPTDLMIGGRGFKHPVSINGPGSESGDGSANGDKQTKKKRKRCGECIGCMRKDNCGSCAPCRNDKSHQICKMRRCEKLTEKKIKVSRPFNHNSLS